MTSSIAPLSATHIPSSFSRSKDVSLNALLNKVKFVANVRFALLVASFVAAAVAVISFAFTAYPLVAIPAIVSTASLVARYFVKEVRPYLILSIDGGGIRGVIPAKILSMIEKRIGCKIAEKFNMITGTSTGAILTSGLTQPDPLDNKKPAFSAKEIRALYENKGASIFTRGEPWDIGALGPKYTADGLYAALSEKFKDTKLNELVADVFVPAFDLLTHLGVFFKHFIQHKEKTIPFQTVDVAMSSGAAPIYFPSHPLSDPREGSTLQYNLIDGGMVANDPSFLAYSEVIKQPDLKDRDIFILSIGTGILAEAPIPSSTSQHWGAFQWFEDGNILNTMFDANDQKTQGSLRSLAKTGHVYYERMQFNLTDKSQEPLDNAHADNIQALKAIAKQSFTGWMSQGLPTNLINPLTRFNKIT